MHAPTFLSLPVALALALACASPSAKEPFQPVSIDDVQRMLGERDVVVIDANVPEVFAAHHLPGARHVGTAPLAALLPPNREAQLVFYCTGPH
jgi:rhodanese-related sulfurtransferase